jgi:predicted metalloendopeptidase
LAENIADVAGISAAYDGYKASGQAAPTRDGYTSDQQFFIAFSQNWGEKSRDAALRQQVMTDSHSPGEYRADTVRNIDAWYKAFDVKPGEKLYLAPRAGEDLVGRSFEFRVSSFKIKAAGFALQLYRTNS